MDTRSHDPVARTPKETPVSWWRGSVVVCWSVFWLVLGASWLICHVTGLKSWLTLLGSISGSLLGAPLIVHLLERLSGVNLGIPGNTENTRD